MTALIESIALPSSEWSLLKTGSPKPIGGFLMIHDTTPPTVSPAFLVFLIRSSIFFAVFGSGHLTIDFSVLLKFIFEKSKSIFTSPTEDTNALIFTGLISCFAIDPATTLTTVSLAELRPPPL